MEILDFIFNFIHIKYHLFCARNMSNVHKCNIFLNLYFEANNWIWYQINGSILKILKVSIMCLYQILPSLSFGDLAPSLLCCYYYDNHHPRVHMSYANLTSPPWYPCLKTNYKTTSLPIEKNKGSRFRRIHETHKFSTMVWT
jgi:hypothetical protein